MRNAYERVRNERNQTGNVVYLFRPASGDDADKKLREVGIPNAAAFVTYCLKMHNLRHCFDITSASHESRTANFQQVR